MNRLLRLPSLIGPIRPFRAIRNNLVENVYVAAADAQVLQRILVEKTSSQFWDQDERQRGLYTRPGLVFYYQRWFSGYLTRGMSAEELADFDNAGQQLAKYDQILQLIEYADDIDGWITTLEQRLQTAADGVPQALYRQSAGNSRVALHKDAELLLQAYADLVDDCAEFPLWQRKFEEELGNQIAYLVGMATAAAREEIDEGHGSAQAAFKRYDGLKQKHFY